MDAKKRMKYDIVVVGGGNAGLVAAISGKNVGPSVLLIEKGPKTTRGGNSRISDANFKIATESKDDWKLLLEGVKLPKEGVDIDPMSKDAFYNTIMKFSEGLADKRLTEICANESFDTVMWMKKQGLEWDLNLTMAAKKNGRFYWAPEAMALQAPGMGEGLVEQLYGIAEKKGITVLYDTSARSLMWDADGGACGVMAKGPDGMIQIEAKSVILACGGWQADPAWRRKYLGENWDLVKLRGTPYDTGDGIKMALEMGAQVTGHWGMCHAIMSGEETPNVAAGLARDQRHNHPHSILVNRNGERFLDEGEDIFGYTYAKFGRELIKQPGTLGFQIFDAKVIPLLRTDYQDAIPVESNTLEGLAEEMDVDVERFVKTVKEFNKAVVDEKPFNPDILDGRRTKGLNPDKTNWAQTIDTPPYRAYATVCGITFSYGGLKADEKAQVIDTSDRPIKGLYAVGEITGGFFYHNYPGGAGLTRGAVMGMIAGAEAASNI